MNETKEMYPSWGDDHGVRLGNVKISDLHDFKEHPFHVVEDTALFELAKSIEDKGVLVPLIVRANPYGEGYEIIAGHRRKAACKWAGLSEVPAMIVELDDNEAVIAMIDSNLQREHIKPSEKAFAYKMKLEAMKQQGKRTDLTFCQVGKKSVENPTLSLAKVGCGYDEIGRCGIAELTINNSALELDENVFSYCEDLTTVTFDNSTVEIGTYAFYDSGDDAAVTFTNCGLDINDKAFQSCGLTTLNISGSETVMGDNAFSYCEDLTDVIIGVGNTEIGTYSFYDCASLVNVSIAADSEDDNLVLVIDDKAFQSCSVQNVVIGRGNVELGDNAFSYCEDLVNVDIKGVLSDIGDYAFYDCPAELVINYNGGSYNKESIEDAK